MMYNRANERANVPPINAILLVDSLDESLPVSPQELLACEIAFFYHEATMNKIMWYLWQLLPFEYHSVYFDEADDSYYHTVWRMWLGRSFFVKRHKIGA